MERKQNYLKDLIYILIGNLIVACGVSFFVLPNNILTGGVSGVAVALEPLIHIDPVWMINGLTIGLYLLGALLLGKTFALKSLVSAICYPVFITLTSYISSLLEPGTLN